MGGARSEDCWKPVENCSKILAFTRCDSLRGARVPFEFHLFLSSNSGSTRQKRHSDRKTPSDQRTPRGRSTPSFASVCPEDPHFRNNRKPSCLVARDTSAARSLFLFQRVSSIARPLAPWSKNMTIEKWRRYRYLVTRLTQNNSRFLSFISLFKQLCMLLATWS